MTNSTKTTKYSTIFLATILVAGTITALFPSFVVGTAQAQPYYDDDIMYNNYNSYDPEYPDKKYESHGYSDYGKDNDRKSYYNSYDKSQYPPSYKPDYKSKYPSYSEKDDRRDKSIKDSSKSVSINNLNCINTNININGNNTGDINLGNEGQGYSGAYSSNGGGEGYGKQDKDFDCIINNNNTNTNIVTGVGDNVTESTATLNVTKTRTCNPTDGASSPAAVYCNDLENTITPDDFNITVTGNNPNPSEFVGSNLIPVVVTLGAGNYEVTEELPDLPTPPEGVTVSRTTTFDGNCTDVDPSDPESIVATGTIDAGESQTCNIDNLYEASTTAGVSLTSFDINTDTSSFDINKDTSDFSPMMTLPTPSP